MSSSTGLSRRAVLRAGLAAAVAPTIWLPRRSQADVRNAPIRRVILIDCVGGPRWRSTFDAASEIRLNPWGVLPWRVVGRGKPPEWGFGRMLLQRPVVPHPDWQGRVLPYLRSDDPANYNTVPPQLGAAWGHARLPTIADIANDIAIVRLTANPGRYFEGDHVFASRTLRTAYPAGPVGVVTALDHALRQQLGSRYDGSYPLGGIALQQPEYSLGQGEYSSSRPIFLLDPLQLPRRTEEAHRAAWALKLEEALDSSDRDRQPLYNAEALDAFMTEKRLGDRHVSQLAVPALDLQQLRAASGALMDGRTPLSNGMLHEAFGLSSQVAPRGDILFDALAFGYGPSSWDLHHRLVAFGLNGAFAVRALQGGASVVGFSVQNFDTHSDEVISVRQVPSQPASMLVLSRLLCGLNFVLRRTADPSAPGKSLWDSTVVVVTSEFGRGGPALNETGFNAYTTQSGSDHDEWNSWLVMGGPVRAGGRLLVDPAHPNGLHHQNRVYTSVLHAMGIETERSSYLPYAAFPRIEGLFT